MRVDVPGRGGSVARLARRASGAARRWNFRSGPRAALLILVLMLAAGEVAANSTPDPWERVNRKIFAFNEGLDRWILEPVAKGWDFVLPDLVQTGISNVFKNAGMPIVILNDLLMLKPVEVGQDLARFVMNSGPGLGGIFDMASRQNIPDNYADFGLTLAHYGTPTGPYVELPLFGPRNVRDSIGLAVDVAATPYGYFIPFYVSLATRTVQIVNTRADFIETIATEREAALDFYIFRRDAYIQNRRFQEGREEEGSDEDLYYFDDEEFDDADLGAGDE